MKMNKGGKGWDIWEDGPPPPTFLEKHPTMKDDTLAFLIGAAWVLIVVLIATH